MSSDPINNGKGYGSGSYGSDPYGFTDTDKPKITSVSSIDGVTLEVLFSEPVQPTTEFFSVSNWVLDSDHGILPEILSVEFVGNSTVQLTHTGTTLGCLYTLTCQSCFDLSGNALDIIPSPFLAKGATPTVEVVPTSENEVRLDFDRVLGEGFDDADNYLIATDFPVSPEILGCAFEGKEVTLYCRGLTSSQYEMTIGSSQAFSGSQSNFTNHSFTDQSGRLTASSTYSVEASIVGVHHTASLTLSDSETALTLHFEQEVEKRIRITSSPTVDFSVPYDWQVNQTVRLIRNQHTGHVSVLMGGVPIYSTGINDIQEAATSPASLVISGVSEMSATVNATASDTLFLADGNFVHELTATFLGLAGNAKNRIQVQRGPLTKGWGDATPAGINDVAVRVNGISVPVIDVNPYLGLIYLETPVPKMPVGTIEVEVDYFWFENPQMSFQSLNHPGLVLNKWDQRRNPEVQSPQLAVGTTNGGSVEGERYPISLTLVRPPRVKPKWVSHRHIGFDKSYTSSLNSPEMLVLNANPLGGYKRKRYDQMSQSGQFEGSLSVDWFGRGNLTLQNESNGYATLTSDEAAGIVRKLDINPVSAQVTLVGRVESSQPTYVNSRLGLGPALAFHDAKDLRLLAAVEIDGVSHIALLTGDEIDNPDSWEPAYSAEATFLTEGRMHVRGEDLPELFHEGLRVVVPLGDQAGHYTVLKIEKLSTGDYWLYVTPDFPADTTKWGGGFGDVYFETPWTETPFNLHLIGKADNASIGVSFTGATSFQCVVEKVSANAHTLYRSGVAPLDLTHDGRGEILFGNLVAGGASSWDFVRYITVPDNFILSSIGHLETLTLSEIPTDKSLWRKTSAHGLVDKQGEDKIILRAEGGADQKLGFEKLDSLIPRMGGVEISSSFKVGSPTSWGDAGIRLKGPNHDVMLATIPYIGDQVFTASSISLIGSHSFDGQGWAVQNFDYTFEGLRLRLAKVNRNPCSLVNELPHVGLSTSRQLDARIAFHHATFNDLDDAGFIIGMDANDKTVTMLFANGKLCLTSDGVNYVGEAAFDWLDGKEHAYRITTGNLTPTGTDVQLWVDDALLLTVPLADFAASDSNVRTYLLGFGIPEYGMDIHSLQVKEAAPPEVKKTLGIWKGGDPNLLSNWQVPREDDDTIIEMDWGAEDPVSVMLVVDPAWGASLLRPDLPTPDTMAVGRTPRHNATGAWATVEWEHLPVHRTNITNIHFGMQNPVSQSSTEWDNFRYRVYIQENEETLPPRTSVLNRWNVLSSGEYTGDITVETVRLKVRTDEIFISESNISAKRVFHVAVNGSPLSWEDWSFDPEKQRIKLNKSYSRSSSAEITFSPGRPITKTYLLNQPLKDGITNLNEGTPPYLLTQLAKMQRSINPDPPRADEINDVVSEHPDFESQDPTRLVEFSHDSAYSTVDFFQVENGKETGLISTPDDGIAPAKGLAHLELEGRMFAEALAPPPAYPFEQGGGAVGAFLTAGGGSDIASGSLGGGAAQGAVMWPSAPSKPEDKPSLANNRTFWEIRDVYEDSVPEHQTESLSYEMEIGGEYSRFGPWGGVETLDPLSLLNGGDFFNGMVLSGGSPLPEPTRIRRRFNENDNNWTE